MSQTTEALLAEIAALPADEKAKLVGLLNGQRVKKETAASVAAAEQLDIPDPELSMRWVDEHRAQYANEYVALMGDQLIAHSANAREVIAAVRAGNFNGAFFGLVSPPDEPMFAGF
jgi:hypothetical protein